jgi:hypothetical protein
MTTIADVSGKLGEYMLKGWVIFLFDLVPVTRADHYTRQVLTDDSCPNSGCHIPLMRSPNGRTPIVYYCANCDENKTCKGFCFFRIRWF